MKGHSKKKNELHKEAETLITNYYSAVNILTVKPLSLDSFAFRPCPGPLVSEGMKSLTPHLLPYVPNTGQECLHD